MCGRKGEGSASRSTSVAAGWMAGGGVLTCRVPRPGSVYPAMDDVSSFEDENFHQKTKSPSPKVVQGKESFTETGPEKTENGSETRRVKQLHEPDLLEATFCWGRFTRQRLSKETSSLRRLGACGMLGLPPLLRIPLNSVHSGYSAVLRKNTTVAKCGALDCQTKIEQTVTCASGVI